MYVCTIKFIIFNLFWYARMETDFNYYRSNEISVNMRIELKEFDIMWESAAQSKFVWFQNHAVKKEWNKFVPKVII